MRRVLTLVVAALLLAGRARAEPVAAALNVSPGPSAGCADRAQLAAAVRARLGRDPFAQQGMAALVVTVRYEKREKWQALVTLSRKNGNQLGAREITTDAPSCADLLDPLALVVALLVDVSAEELPPEPAPELAPVPPPPPRVLRIPPRPEEPRALRVLWAVSAGVSFGMLPETASGGNLGLWLEPSEYFSAGVAAGYWLSQRTEVDGRSAGPAGMDIRMDSLSAEVCGPHLGADSIWVRPCLVQRFSRLSASAFGFLHSREQTRFAVGTGLGGQLFLPVAGPVGLFAAGSAELQWIRDRFVYLRPDGTRGELHRSAPVAVFFQGGIGLSF